MAIPRNHPVYFDPLGRKILGWILALLAVFSVGHLLVIIHIFRSEPPQAKALARLGVQELLVASRQYFREYGMMPPPEHFVPALSGDNPHKIAFYQAESDPRKVVDPWGTSYRFDLSKPESPRVWSCGPNHHDDNGAEGSDDIVSWR